MLCQTLQYLLIPLYQMVYVYKVFPVRCKYYVEFPCYAKNFQSARLSHRMAAAFHVQESPK